VTRVKLGACRHGHFMNSEIQALGQLIGSSGLYGDARSGVYFDHVKFEPNR
jgi:hypothetical protein